MGDPSLDGRIEIVHAYAQDLVHLRQVDAHAAVEREDLPLERCPGAEGDNRHAALGRGPDDGADFVGGAGIDDEIRCGRRVIRLPAAVVLPNGRRRGRAIAEQVLEGTQQVTGDG